MYVSTFEETICQNILMKLTHFPRFKTKFFFFILQAFSPKLSIMSQFRSTAYYLPTCSLHLMSSVGQSTSEDQNAARPPATALRTGDNSLLLGLPTTEATAF